MDTSEKKVFTIYVPPYCKERTDEIIRTLKEQFRKKDTSHSIRKDVKKV